MAVIIIATFGATSNDKVGITTILGVPFTNMD